MGRWDKREQELLEQQAQSDTPECKATKQDGIDIDGNGVIDADEGQNVRQEDISARRGYHK